MAELGQDLDALVVEEKKDYDAAVEASAKKADTEVELGMRAVFVHGDEVIADAAADPDVQTALRTKVGGSDG